MTRIHVQTEIENTPAKCWDYTVLVERDSGDRTEHRIRLSWVDHEHWCGGRLPPSQVVEAVVERLVAHGMTDTLPERFDAARARRWFPEIDRELRSAC